MVIYDSNMMVTYKPLKMNNFAEYMCSRVEREKVIVFMLSMIISYSMKLVMER